MLTIYPSVFMKELNGAYSVCFPDFDNVCTCGDDFNDAYEMAVDLLVTVICGEKEDRNTIPNSTPMEKVNLEDIAEYFETTVDQCRVVPVSVNVEEYIKNNFNKPVKKTLTIPSWLNDWAKEAGVNFSQLLTKALKEEYKLSKQKD